MIILSLFDGISCGREALKRAGIQVDKYYASEIEIHAEAISRYNYPDIIRLGDVNNWRSWSIEQPDIILAGFPCQSFSLAGKRLNFDDPRGQLFFTLCDILRHYKPKYFLLENVKMKSEIERAINYELGRIYPEHVQQPELFGDGELLPVLINSARVSAQSRQRNYWCNGSVKQPKDKGILLQDVLESGISNKDKSYPVIRAINKDGHTDAIKDKMVKRTLVAEPIAFTDKAHCLCSSYAHGETLKHCLDKKTRTLVSVPACLKYERTEHAKEVRKEYESGELNERRRDMRQYGARKDGKTNTLTTVQKDNYIIEPVCVAERGRYDDNGKAVQTLEQRKDGKTNTLTTVQKDNYVMEPAAKKPMQLGHIANTNAQANRVYSVSGKSVTLKSEGGGGGAKTGLYKIDLPDGDYLVRKLTPLECERLQTLPEGFTEYGRYDVGKKGGLGAMKRKTAKTNRYKCIGNGWSVDIIVHILLSANIKS